MPLTVVRISSSNKKLKNLEPQINAVLCSSGKAYYSDDYDYAYDDADGNTLVHIQFTNRGKPRSFYPQLKGLIPKSRLTYLGVPIMVDAWFHTIDYPLRLSAKTNPRLAFLQILYLVGHINKKRYVELKENAGV